MLALNWYSLVLVGLAIVSLLIDIIAGDTNTISGDLWGVVLFIPVIVFLILLIIHKNRYYIIERKD